MLFTLIGRNKKDLQSASPLLMWLCGLVVACCIISVTIADFRVSGGTGRCRHRCYSWPAGQPERRNAQSAFHLLHYGCAWFSVLSAERLSLMTHSKHLRYSGLHDMKPNFVKVFV